MNIFSIKIVIIIIILYKNILNFERENLCGVETPQMVVSVNETTTLLCCFEKLMSKVCYNHLDSSSCDGNLSTVSADLTVIKTVPRRFFGMRNKNIMKFIFKIEKMQQIYQLLYFWYCLWCKFFLKVKFNRNLQFKISIFIDLMMGNNNKNNNNKKLIKMELNYFLLVVNVLFHEALWDLKENEFYCYSLYKNDFMKKILWNICHCKKIY